MITSKYLYRIVLTFLIVVSSQVVSFGKLISFPFYEGPLEELQKSAIYNNKPVVVYFYENQCKTCRDLERRTWNDQNLINFARVNVLASRKNLYTFEGSLLARQYNIDQPGTILIFSPTGSIVERITYSIGAEELLSRLEDTYQQYQPEPIVVSQTYSETQITRSEDMAVNEIVDADKKPKYSEVPEFFYRSPEAFTKSKYREAYTVIYQRVSKLKKIKQRIRKIRKKWPNKIWIMEEERPNGEHNFVIALGKYNDLEEAEYYASIFEFWHPQPKEVLKLNGLFDE